MPLAEATTLAGGDDTASDNIATSARRLYIEPYDPAADRAALEALADRCQCYSPIVALESSDPPEALLLDLTGLEHLFPSELRLGQTILADLGRRGLKARIAVADTLGAAWGLARFAQPPYSRLRLSNASPGDGKPLCVVPRDRLAEALSRLPIEALRLESSTAATLRHLGIDRVGQLEALPPAELATRFGPGLLRRLDQAFGRAEETLGGHYALPELEVDRALDYPAARRDTVESLLQSSIEQLTAQLDARSLGAVRLDCRLWCEGAREITIPVGLFQPTTSAGRLVELAQTCLERTWLPGPVSRVLVRAAVTAPLQLRQQTMFSDSDAQRSPRQMAGLIERLSSRLGARAVLRPQITTDAQPEWACHYHVMVGRADRPGRRQARRCPGSAREEAAWNGLPERPMVLLKRPVAVAATAVVPDGPPLRFEFKGQSHQVARSWGPEQIETGWWRGRMVGRDYYRVETTSGRRFWLFRRLRDRHWFLHGMFE